MRAKLPKTWAVLSLALGVATWGLLWLTSSSEGARNGKGAIDNPRDRFDMRCSAPKSVSVLFGLGDDRVRKEVIEAHDAAVRTMVDWVETRRKGDEA